MPYFFVMSPDLHIFLLTVLAQVFCSVRVDHKVKVKANNIVFTFTVMTRVSK